METIEHNVFAGCNCVSKAVVVINDASVSLLKLLLGLLVILAWREVLVLQSLKAKLKPRRLVAKRQ